MRAFIVWCSLNVKYGLGKSKRRIKTGEGENQRERKETKFSVSHVQQLSTDSSGACAESSVFLWPVCTFLPAFLLQFVEILTNVASIDGFISVLFFLAKEAEPLLAILLFPIFVAHGNASGITWAGGDGRHRHGTAERPRTSRRLFSCWNGAEDGADPGAHFRL